MRGCMLWWLQAKEAALLHAAVEVDEGGCGACRQRR
jgi:hypothetical protein